MKMPVGTNALSRGLSVIGSARLARRSIPADEGVLYDGSGFDDLFMIFTITLSIIISLKFVLIILCENNKNI